MTDPAKPRRFRSATLYDGTLRTTTRSFLRALGQDDEDIERPHIGVFHTGGEMSPCNLNLREQAQHAKTGVYAGGGTPHDGAQVCLGQPALQRIDPNEQGGRDFSCTVEPARHLGAGLVLERGCHCVLEVEDQHVGPG